MFRTSIIAATLAITFSAAPAAEVKPLQIKVYNAGDASFNVNSTLVYGQTEAIVIDAGFTRADALRIAANVLDSGVKLKTILVSQADPDYYFGVATLKEFFPDVQVVATPAVLEKLTAKVNDKLAFWGPKMGANAPKLAVIPTALQGTTLTVDGQVLEIKGTQGLLAHRPYVWIPSIKAIAGSLGIFGNLHVWTADTQTVAERAAWISQLDDMAALHPAVVVPGHMNAGTKLDANSITYTQNYLRFFETEIAKTSNSAELIEAMKSAYPNAPVGVALEIGAKVNKGEMKW